MELSNVCKEFTQSAIIVENRKEKQNMAELWDIYDIHKKKVGRTPERNVYQFKGKEYHIVVTGIKQNSKNEILITKLLCSRDRGL